jgi:hypothetical protein
MTATLGKRQTLRPIGPNVAGVIPTFTGEYKLDYTDGVGAETETWAVSVSSSISNWNTVPDLIINIYGRTQREDMGTTGSEESIVYQGGVLTISGETFEDIDWLRAEVTLVDWRSLNRITFRAPTAWSVVVELEVNSAIINRVIGGKEPSYWEVDFGELDSLASDPETDALEIRVYFKDEAGSGTYPFSYTAAGTKAYLSSALPVTIELDFYNEFETLEGTVLTAGLGALTAVGLSELTAIGIEKMTSKDGLLGSVAPHLVGMGGAIGVALGVIWLNGWITSLKDFEQIIVSLPQVAGAILIGTAGPAISGLINKYSGVGGQLASAVGMGADAATKAVMTATLVAALSVIGFDMRPAGTLE